MRRLNFLTRDDLRELRVSTRVYWMEARWTGWNAARRAAAGDAVLAKLAGSLHGLDDDGPPYIADPELRLFTQLKIERFESRVALDLGRHEEAMTFASRFNGHFQVLMNSAEEEGDLADNPKLWEDLAKINKDLYDEVVAAWQQHTG